jgi:GT2 family glycosyltransferase
MTQSHRRHAETGVGLFPPALLLTPTSRWPTTLPEATVRAVLDTPLERTVPAFVPAPGVPRASIVIVTRDGLAFTRLCLESLVAAVSPAFEIIVVDNGSTDGTAAYLDQLSMRDRRVKVALNLRNLGFGAATNRGAEIARGDVLILLNNDTIVPSGSLERLTMHLSDSRIGLVGAVTNRAGNEAQIDVPYRTCGELAQFATEYMAAHRGELFDIRTATMFCAAVPRRVWSEVGPLDERFEIGLFEDEDYAMRVRQAGYRVVCAEDVFVHHFGQASMGRLAPTGEYGPLFHANRARWEAKWGLAWRPYARRERRAYNELVARVRVAVCEAIPVGATVAVISKGDAELLQLGERRAWHFPQHEDGTYAGHYPADSADCIAELERLRAKGADFLVVPSTASWWLDYYDAFGRYLADRCRVVLRTSDCAVVALCGAGDDGRVALPSNEVNAVDGRVEVRSTDATE